MIRRGQFEGETQRPMHRVRRGRLTGGDLAQLIHDRETGDVLVVVDESVTDPELSTQLINDLLRRAEDHGHGRQPPAHG